MTTSQLFDWLFIFLLALFIDFGMFRWAQHLWRQERETLSGQAAQLAQRLLSGLARLVTLRQLAAPTTTTIVPPQADAPQLTTIPSPRPETIAGSQPSHNTASPSSATVESGGVALAIEQTASLAPPVARVTISLDLPPGARVRLTVESLSEGVSVTTDSLPSASATEIAPPAPTSGTPARPASPARRVRLAWPMPLTLAGAKFIPLLTAGWQRVAARLRVLPLVAWLFIGASVIYLATRFYALEEYPIYFFGDEAIQTNQAATFVARGFRDAQGRWFPTYFQNATFYNLGASVYLQIVPYMLFGKSVLATRAVSALMSATAALAIALALRHVFKLKAAWAGLLLLALAPGWFLYSRTAFENVILATFYAWFLYFYLLYRDRSPRFLFPALLCGALAFYSYKGSQLVVVVTGLLFLISDFRYHLRHWRNSLWGAAWLAVLLLPYLRFSLEQPSETFNHLRIIDSYWTDDQLTATQKLFRFFKEYTYGLSPQYWFLPNNGRDLTRHMLKNYGQMPLVELPLFLLGIGVCLWRFRSPTHRALLLALLATPTGGALAAVGLGRVLVFIVPATLLGGLGLDRALTWLEQWAAQKIKWPKTGAWLGVGVFAGLSALTIGMTLDAVTNGPRWYTDYGLYGMQYGARQVFGEAAPRYLQRPDVRQFVVSPTWANSTDFIRDFFIPAAQRERVPLQGLDYYLYDEHPLTPDMVFALPANEYVQAQTEPKVVVSPPKEIIYNPDGTPGFYITRLSYSPEAEAIFAEEREARRRPVTDTITLDGQVVTVVHSQFGAGSLVHVLDGDTFTLIRGLEANPIVFDFQFPEARQLGTLRLTTGSMPNFTVRVEVYPGADQPPIVAEQNFLKLGDDPTFEAPLTPGPAQRVVISIHDNQAGDTAAIHVREIEFLP